MCVLVLPTRALRQAARGTALYLSLLNGRVFLLYLLMQLALHPAPRFDLHMQDPSLMHSLVSMPSEGGLLAMAAPSTPAAAMALPAAPSASAGGSAGGVLEFHAGERQVSPSVKVRQYIA